MIKPFESCKNILFKLNWLPALLARITVGWVFVESGWGKLHNLDKVIGYFTDLGIPLPGVQAPMVAGIEFIGGLLLIAGFATRFVAALLIGIMSVAILTAKLAEIASLSDLFATSEFLYIVLLLVLLFDSARMVSVDYFISKKVMKS